MAKPELSIVIPFFNEEANVENVYKKINRSLNGKLSYQLVLVDNGSSDDTARILHDLSKTDRKIKIVTVKKNIGYGFGIVSGLNSADGEIIGWTDGDDTIDPNSYLMLYRKMKETGCDAGLSERTDRGQTAYRKIASFWYNTMLFLMYMKNFRDVNAKPKMIKRAAYKTFRLKSKDWFVDTEFCINVYKKKLKFCRLLTAAGERKKGKSTVRRATIIEFLKNAISYRILGKV